MAEVPNNNFHARCDHTPESSKWFSLQYIDQWSVSGFKYHFNRGWRRAMPCRVKGEGEKEFSQNWNFLKCLHCYRKGRLLSISKICWHNVIVYDDGAACIIPLWNNVFLWFFSFIKSTTNNCFDALCPTQIRRDHLKFNKISRKNNALIHIHIPKIKC